ncbi:RDD family protein [Kineosporiaceae bacterium SCSIO 59966]|nr:RDD family protein [Kineosporiaceae bacterium SCSIO 59966]
MVGRRDVGSWISGPSSVAQGRDDDWPGRRLGRPRQGAGSVARVGRRLLAVGVDWALASAISAAFLDGDPWGTLAVFGLAQLVLVGTLGMGVGHALLGMRVVRLDGGWAGPGRAAVRTLLLCLAVPALVWDRDQRGMHDRAAGTVLVLR